MASIRDKIVDRIVEKLETITLANGYTFDVGEGRVHRARSYAPHLTPPCIVLAQGPEQVENKVGDRDRRKLVLDLVFVANNAAGDVDGQACTFMRDIQTALGGIRAAGTDSQITVDLVGGGTDTYQFILTEVANEVNFSDVLPDLIYGGITYLVEYRSAITDSGKH